MAAFSNWAEKGRSASLLLGVVLLTSSWLAPGHYYPWTAFQAESLAFLAVGFLFASALATNAPACSHLAILTAAAAVVPLAQTAAGQILFLSDGVLSACYLVTFAVAMITGTTLVRSVERAAFLDSLTAAFAVAAIASSGMAMAQWLRVGDALFLTGALPGQRVYANMAQPNHLATLLALGIVAMLRAFQSRQISAWVTALSVAWLASGLVLTQSRTAWLFAAVLLVWCASAGRKAGIRLKPATVLVGILLFAVAVVSLPWVNRILDLQAFQISFERRTTAVLRWYHWQVLLDALRQAPWFGYGWNQVMLAQAASAWKFPATGELLFNSHNLLFDLLLWNGAILGALLIAAIAAWFVLQVRLCRTPDQWLLLLGVSAIFLHALVEFPLNYAYFLIPAGLMMGALDGMRPESQLRRIPRLPLIAAGALLATLLAWTAADYMQIEAATWRLRFAAAGIGSDRVADAPPPDIMLLDGPREAHRFRSVEPVRGMSRDQLVWMRRVASRVPYPGFLLRMALAEGLNGFPDASRRALTLVCKTNPIDRCDEARVAWRSFQTQHAELEAISFPEPDGRTW